jgi:hypothetical protein
MELFLLATQSVLYSVAYAVSLRYPAVIYERRLQRQAPAASRHRHTATAARWHQLPIIINIFAGLCTSTSMLLHVVIYQQYLTRPNGVTDTLYRQFCPFSYSLHQHRLHNDCCIVTVITYCCVFLTAAHLRYERVAGQRQGSVGRVNSTPGTPAGRCTPDIWLPQAIVGKD